MGFKWNWLILVLNWQKVVLEGEEGRKRSEEGKGKENDTMSRDKKCPRTPQGGAWQQGAIS